MTTRSALVALLRESKIEFVEARSRLMVDISSVSLESVKQFHDLAVSFFVFKFSNPRTEVYFQRSELREAIRFYPIVQKNSDVFANLVTFTR